VFVCWRADIAPQPGAPIWPRAGPPARGLFSGGRRAAPRSSPELGHLSQPEEAQSNAGGTGSVRRYALTLHAVGRA
jgi:hypothetical protein